MKKFHRKYENLFYRTYSDMRLKMVHRARAMYLSESFGSVHIPMLDLGRELSRYIAGEECSDWLEFAGSFEKNLRNEHLRKVLVKTAERQGKIISLCAGCKSVFVDDDAPYSNTHDGRICEDCAEDHVTTEDTGRFISVEDCTAAYTRYEYGCRGAFIATDAYTRYEYRGRNAFTTVAYFESSNGLCELVIGDMCQYATRDAINQSDWHYWESDECYHEEPDPDDYDDDDDCSNGVFDYGCHPLRKGGYFGENSVASDPAIGMEHEVYVPDTDDIVSGCGHELILERDGSLDRVHGVEIVHHPRTLEEWKDYLDDYCSDLNAWKVSGYDTPGDEEYGIHLTVHRRHLSPLQEVRLAMLLSASENADFIRATAQRWNIYGAIEGRGIGAYAKADQKVAVLGGLRPCQTLTGKKRVSGQWKFEPLNFKPTLAEFRIFQSTTNKDRLLKNFEFIHAVLAWTNSAAMTGTSWNYIDFWRWLDKKEYPVLCEYLSRDTFPVKYRKSEVVNTWGKK